MRRVAEHGEAHCHAVMPDAGSLYDVLLVEQTATVDEIKVAFKRRALQVHPDKGAGQF